ncbi:MAG: ABC transporter substrate-binding protein [Oscillospiraceae bacterium]|jgi:peptide/nickel transport system substrate-binding protein|nr:ABC transporter substrate-binding protein [Oscillospiraceae bacterium]
MGLINKFMSCIFLFLLSFFILSGCVMNVGTKDSKIRSNSLIYAQSEELCSLDPSRVGDFASATIIYNIYESLLKFKEGTLEITSNLAERWEESEDHISFTFYLRKNVKFHDGTDFNAEAVKFNVDRQLNSDEKMPYADFVYGVVELVKVMDEYTVTFVLKEQCNYFLKNMAMDIGAFYASPKAIKESVDNDITKNPVGTGPYKFDYRKAGQITRLVVNDGYWGKKAKIKTLIFKLIVDPSARVFALENGEVDAIEKIDMDSMNRIKATNNNIAVSTSNVLGTHYMAFNTRKQPFNNRDLRRIICQAFDVVSLTKSICKDYVTAANCLLPPEIPGHDPNIKYSSYNKQAVEEYFKNFKVEKIKILTLSTIGTFGSNQQWAEALQAYLKEYNIETQIEACDLKAYLDKISDSSRDYDICFYRWISDNGDPDNFFQILSKDNTEINCSGYDCEEFENILNKGKNTSRTVDNIENFKQVYKEAENIIKRDLPILPLYYNKEWLANVKALKGLKYNLTGTINFSLAYWEFSD